MEPYKYEIDGEGLRIQPGPNGGAWVRVTTHGVARIVEVEPSAVPDAALALYEAAGLGKPLILPRPLDLPIGTADQNANVAGYAVWLENGRLFLDEFGIERGNDPRNALLLAAAIAVHAEAAEGIHSAGVESLAVAIHRAQCNTSPDQCDGCREVARKILLGGWKRETQA